MATIVWTDHQRRLVMQEGETPQYHLEVQEGDMDAMGRKHWRPMDINWDLFTTILGNVVAWKPVELSPEDLQ